MGRAPQLGLLEGLRAASGLRFVGALRQWANTHLWAGGWGFLQPPRAAYDAAIAALLLGAAAALVVARRRRTPLPGGSRWIALATLGFLFLAAMLFHLLAAAAAARVLGTGPLAGGEGWYFDLLRPIEACAAAALFVAAVPARLTRVVVGALMVLLLALDVAGTFGLLLPHWAGLASAGRSFSAIQDAARGARDAAPLLYPAFLPLFLAAVVLGACVTAVQLTGRKAKATGG